MTAYSIYLHLPSISGSCLLHLQPTYEPCHGDKSPLNMEMENILKLNALPKVVQSFITISSFLCIAPGCCRQQLQTDCCQCRYYRPSKWHQLLERNEMNIQLDSKLPGMVWRVTYGLLGDKGYPLLTYLMGSYSARNLDVKKQSFDYLLSRVQRSIEHAFGIICTK